MTVVPADLDPADLASGGDLPFRLVATDLDGTLLTSAETVSERTRAALAAVTSAGAQHIVVTGRGARWARPVLDAIGYTGIAVCGQGAQVYDAGEHRLLTSVTLDRQLARLALEKIEAEVGRPAVAASQDGLDGEVLAGPGYRALSERLPIVRVGGVDELLAAPIGKLYLQHPELTDDELADAVRRVAGGLVDVTVAGASIVELLPVGLSKATGLSVAARRLGVTARQTIAFGDMPNDLPMFRWAGYGVAMANGHEELKAVADEIAPDHDADGVAVVLERIFELG